MADDSPFNPPLGEVVIPTVQADANAICAQIVALILQDGPSDLQVRWACAKREGSPWIPLVTAYLGEASWMMSPATARLVAARAAVTGLFDTVYHSGAEVARMFTDAAGQAEDLAAGQPPPAKELH